MVWCVAASFFIGNISRDRTVRQTILGGYVFGVGSTLTSFIVFGNYSMGMQVTGKQRFVWHDCIYHQNDAGCTCYYGSSSSDDNCFLCDFF